MNLPRTSGLVVWLLPGPEPYARYSQFIRRLANRYKAPPFIPHITLSKVPVLETGLIKSSLRSVANMTSPFRVKTGVPVCGESPYQKITIPLVDEVITDAVGQKIDKQFGGRFSKQSGFHLSLLYSRALCRSIDMNRIEAESPDCEYLYIQQIALAEINAAPRNWEVLVREPLTGRSSV